MLRGFLLVALLGMAALLSGCATLSKAQCEAGDWYNLGVSDGARGLPISQIDEHVSACAEHGISVNRSLYEGGRTQGLQSYCRLDRAESDGRAGRTNYHACTGQFGVSFDRVFDAAEDVYRVQNDIIAANAEMDALLRRFTQDGISAEERASLKAAITNQQNAIEILQDRRLLEEQELRFIVRQEELRVGR